MDKPRIAVCLPGSIFTQKFLMSWSKLYAHMIDTCDQVWLNYSAGTFLNDIRSNAVGAQPNVAGQDFVPWGGEIDYTHILWIDSDMADFEPWMLERLLSLDHFRVIGAAYPKANLSAMTAAVQGPDGEPRDMIGIPNVVTPVVYMGFGFLLIKKGVLEQMQFPWFDHIHLRADWLPLGRRQVGEDVSFFHKLQQTGIQAYLDPEVSKAIGHEKPVVLKYADVLRHNGIQEA